MTDKRNNQLRRAGILNLVAQHERGILPTSLYKTNVTNIKVNRLPIFSEQSNIPQDFDDSFDWCFVRSGVRGDLIGVGWKSNISERHTSLCLFEFMTRSSLDEDKSFVKKISNKYSIYKDMIITDTADLCYRNQNPLLIVGNFDYKRCSSAILSAHSFYCGHPEYEWIVNGPTFCCASEINSVNFALGCANGFFVCKNLRMSNKYNWNGDISDVEFNDDGNLLFVSSTQSGIQLCDMRENIEQCQRNSPLYIKESVVNDPPFIANKMKLLSDQVTLIVSDDAGYISKIDLRIKKSVFQYSEHKSFQYNRPLNVDEDLDLLCAVDNVNCCRLWSLSSGKLHWAVNIAPINCRRGPFTAHACILSSERRWFVAIVENDTVTPIVPDEIEAKAFRPEVIRI